MSIDLEVNAKGVALITINRPERRNALDAAHYEALTQAWTRVRDDAAIRCAIVTGAGDVSFCAGADIKDLVGTKRELADLWLTQKGMLLNRGLEVWKPIIAAVNGYCLGGGMTLLQATDIRVAAPNAEFGLSEVKRGLIAGNGGTQRLLAQFPYAVGMKMILTGERMTAADAERWGLINDVVEQDQLLAQAYEYADIIAANAPLAVQAVKELVVRSRTLNQSDGLRMEQLVSSILQQQSEDVQEGRSAFAEKREPNFRGR